MKSMLMAIMAVAVAVTFTAPSFAEEKKKKEGGHVVVSAEEKKKDASTKADEIFGEKKEEAKPKK